MTFASGLRPALAACLWMTAAAAAADSQVLNIVGPWEISGLEPSVSGYLFSKMQVTETLTDADGAGRPLPGLAQRWSVTPDGLVWRFSLRPAARFHDGSPVEADHVARMLRRAYGKPGMLGMAPIQEIGFDGRDVVIRLLQPFSALPAVLAHTSTQILAPSSFDDKGAVRRVIGSGPYRITQLLPPQRFSIAAYAGWTGTPPAIERASYLSVGRAETRALMAESGQADLAYGLDPASVRRLRKNPGLAVLSVTTPRTMLLKVNAGHRWLKDIRVRRAISLALDREGMARALLRDPELAADQLFPPTLAEWHVARLPPLRHAPGEARRLLAEAGWRPGPDGILTREGERLSVRLRTFPDRPELPLLATAIQEQLRQIGIAAKVLIGNSSDIPATHRDGSLELALVARNFALVPDPIGTIVQDYGRHAGRPGGDWGAMNWSNAALDQTVARLTGLTDVSQRASLRERVSRILHEELPVIPVVWYRQNAAVNPRIGNVMLDPLERSYRLSEIRWARPAVEGMR